MIPERKSLARRAAKHAALGEPARLAIVDALAWGDRSPRDLQDALGIASNLMAHHIKILQNAGIVTRKRSEGDRRRTYLQLVPSSLEELFAPTWPRQDVSRVVFVCTANSARSQLAAALWRKASEVPATSAGTHPADRIAPGAVAAARRHGLALRTRRPRALPDIANPDDLLITVCDLAREELGDTPVAHWSVPDPVPVGTTTAFDAAFDEITQRITSLAPHLTAPSPSERNPDDHA